MSIDALPPAPAATDPVDAFDAKAFAFFAALQTFRTQANDLADGVQINADILAAVLLGMALPGYAGTSASSFAVGTGSKTFATQTGKLWTVGQIVVVSNGANVMRGPVTAYSGGNLTVNVTSAVGGGTYSSWTIGLTFEGLLLAKSGANDDITSLSGLTTPLSAAQGGTGSSVGAVLLVGAQTIAGVKTFSSMPVLPTKSKVRLHSCSGVNNGYATTNTCILRFSNVVANVGTDITYLDSAALGASFTVNVAGTYAISSYVMAASGTMYHGLSLNGTQLSTSIASLANKAECLGFAFNNGGNQQQGVPVTIDLVPGDVIRVHADGVAVRPDHGYFTMVRVS